MIRAAKETLKKVKEKENFLRVLISPSADIHTRKERAGRGVHFVFIS